jgi:hypothetical protein
MAGVSLAPQPRFKIGDRLRVWMPGARDHGAPGVISRVTEDAPFGYFARDGWRRAGDQSPFFDALREEYLVSEDEFYSRELKRD